MAARLLLPSAQGPFFALLIDLDGLCWTLDHYCIDDGLRLLLIMCYWTDRLVRCEVKNGKVLEKQAPHTSPE
jgi:hypothetical protein